MTRKHVVVGLVVLALVAGGLWYLRSGDGDGPATAEPASDTETAVPRAPDRAGEGSDQGAASAGTQTTSLVMDADPVGALVLEGQVLDASDDPVEGAMVYLASRPPRTATTAADGSFSFDKLVGRRYGVSARRDEMAGGPVIYDLTADSDPVVIRLRASPSLRVTVIDRTTGTAIAGAMVGMAGMDDAFAATDADGVATVKGVRSGWEQMVVKASGYATHKQFMRVPDAAMQVERRVELERGFEIAGTVVDKATGEPVANARVIARSSARPFDPIDVFSDGVNSDAKGRFAIEGLAVGTYRFLAIHERYAPGTSAGVTISESSQPAVEIALEEGGVVVGKVVDGAGAAAPWAQVNLTTRPEARGQWGGGVQRQVVAGDDGRFEIGGLPRERMSLIANTAEASSPIVDVDLAAASRVQGLELTLTITGAITGTVVDEAGEPVAEAQVYASPDFWGGENASEIAIRGGGVATTDGGGRFAIRGLADGSFLLRASRSVSIQQSLGKQTKARTGDSGVRLVLAREGGVKGRVAMPDGAAPELAIASIGWAGAVPVTGGAFQIDGVPPGTYDLTLSGPFPRRTVKDVVIESGKTADVGTVKIDPGRVVSGRVLGPNGRPVEGAQVALGQQIVGDGANLVTQLDEATAQALGIRRGTSGADGSYRIAGVGPDEAALAAEHPELGRSLPVTIAPAGQDARHELRLVPFGSVTGTVTISGKPAPDVSVIASSTTSARQVVATTSGHDGGFAIDRIAAGEYKVLAMIGGGATAQMAAAQVVVEPGKAATAELDIAVGDIDYAVLVTGKDGAQVDAAQVFLFGNPELSPKTGDEVQQAFISTGASGTAKMAFANAGTAAVFEKIEPGDYARCVIPITGDMNDPTFAQRLQQNVATIAVYCAPIEVAPSPARQNAEVAVPAMTPLPE